MTVVWFLMKPLSFNIPAAKLRRLNLLSAVNRNETPWRSTYAMLKRFRDLEPFLIQIDDDDVQALLPKQDKKIDVHRILKQLEDLNFITKKLQSDSVTLYDPRIMFNTVIEQDLLAKKRLDPNAAIVQNSVFEKAIVQMQSEMDDSLTAHNRRAVVHLKKHSGHCSWSNLYVFVNFAAGALTAKNLYSRTFSTLRIWILILFFQLLISTRGCFRWMDRL